MRIPRGLLRFLTLALAVMLVGVASAYATLGSNRDGARGNTGRVSCPDEDGDRHKDGYNCIPSPKERDDDDDDGCAKRVIRGTNGADVLVGTRRAERIRGRGGNDTIDGRGGKDCLFGGSGDDTITARDGRRDRVDCGSGRGDTAVVDRFDSVRRCETVDRD